MHKENSLAEQDGFFSRFKKAVLQPSSFSLQSKCHKLRSSDHFFLFLIQTFRHSRHKTWGGNSGGIGTTAVSRNSRFESYSRSYQILKNLGRSLFQCCRIHLVDLLLLEDWHSKLTKNRESTLSGSHRFTSCCFQVINKHHFRPSRQSWSGHKNHRNHSQLFCNQLRRAVLVAAHILLRGRHYCFHVDSRLTHNTH